MAGLLVSVRSAAEAMRAVEGGASVIDVKEPNLGSLGRASSSTWQAVRAIVPRSIPVSVALGELADWTEPVRLPEGIAFRKLGLAGAGRDWQSRWAEVRRLEAGTARWVAVAYADWERARSPDPAAILQEAIQVADCSGILVDTWEKTHPSTLSTSVEWRSWVDQAQQARRFVVLAGSLGLADLARLAPLKPDLFAVRGAACPGSRRTGTIDPERVRELAQAVLQMGRARDAIR